MHYHSEKNTKNDKEIQYKDTLNFYYERNKNKNLVVTLFLTCIRENKIKRINYILERNDSIESGNPFTLCYHTTLRLEALLSNSPPCKTIRLVAT